MGWRASLYAYSSAYRNRVLRGVARDYGLDGNCPKTREALMAFAAGQRLGIEQLKYLACGSGDRVLVYGSSSGLEKGKARHIDFNYAATKPNLMPVEHFAIDLGVHFNQNVGRSSGAHAEIMTGALEQARDEIGRAVGADPQEHVVIFRHNTTAGMNTLIGLAARKESAHFVLSLASHHSAQLPARLKGKHEFFWLNPNGTYDLNHMESVLRRIYESEGKLPVLCIESESNVTGYKNPIARICEIAARYRALVFIDHAQGASSMRINLSKLPGRVFIAMSGHKVYARSGSGAIVGPRDFFVGNPLEAGGGTIDAVTINQVHFSTPPHNHEAGTPAFIEQASFGRAMHLLMEAGFEDIERGEEQMIRAFWPRLLSVEGLEVLGERELDAAPRGPVVSFSLKSRDGKKIPPGFIGSALQAFYGIDSRVGQFCAHPYVYFLTGAAEADVFMHAQHHVNRGRAGCAALPGDERFHATRISWGFPTRQEDLLALPQILAEIRRMWPSGSALRLDLAKGEFYIPDQPRPLTRGVVDLLQAGPRDREAFLRIG